MTQFELLKVSSKSNPHAVAGAMANIARNGGAAEVHVVGAGALNQAIKAVAIARGFVEDAGVDLVCVPSFTEVAIDGEMRTALQLIVEARAREAASSATRNP